MNYWYTNKSRSFPYKDGVIMPTQVTLVFPPGYSPTKGNRQHAASSLSHLATTVREICHVQGDIGQCVTTPEEGKITCAKDCGGLLSIILMSSTAGMIETIEKAAETTLAGLCPKLGIDPDNFQIKIDPGKNAPKSPSGSCAINEGGGIDREE